MTTDHLPRHRDTILPDQARTLHGLFRLRASRTPKAPAYHQYDAIKQKWRTYTWEDMAKRAMRWQEALAREDLQPGDRVAIWLPNGVNWVCFDQAALSLGLVVVPLFADDTPGNVAYILANSGCKLLLLSDLAHWRALADFPVELPALERVLCVSPSAEPAPSRPISLSFVADWLLPGKGDWQDRSPIPEGLATIVYTSGTTGRPKGVMLSHRNILCNAAAILEVIYGYREDLYLSFLPLSHTFERTVGYYLPVMAGSSVAFSRSIKDLPEDMAAIRPTMLIAVPRIFDKIYARVWQQVETKGRLSAKILKLTIDLGWRRFEAAQGRGRPLGPLQALVYELLHRLVARKILDRLGGRLRLAVSGGAPLFPDVSRFFISLGLPLLQGYGLTEASPVVSANHLGDNVPESVGIALPGVEVRTGNDNELLIRGPSVMQGYWNRPADTQAAVDPGGWLHTGDQGEIVDRRLYIRGRLKEILVTSTGEKVSPADLEMAICQDPLFDSAMIVGEGKPYLCALLVLNPEQWTVLSARVAQDPADPASLTAAPVHQAVIDRIGAALVHFPIHAQIRKVCLTLEPWSLENGLLTPTLKIKRQQIEARFADMLNHIYGLHNRIE